MQRVIGVLAGCAFLMAACDKPQSAAPMRVDDGAALYAEHCAWCHGAKPEGQPDWRRPLPNGRMPAPPHDESGHTWHHTDEVLFGITKYGVTPKYAPPGYQSDMPAFGGRLSDDEIWAALSFIASHWKTKE